MEKTKEKKNRVDIVRTTRVKLTAFGFYGHIPRLIYLWYLLFREQREETQASENPRELIHSK